MYRAIQIHLLSLLYIATVAAQINPGAALGSALGPSVFDSTSKVLLRSVREPRPKVDVGPKELDFRGVALLKSALNVVIITNGTAKPVEVQSLSTSRPEFRVAARLVLPLLLPAQTEALVTVEFVPRREGKHASDLTVRYRTVGGRNSRLRIALKGRGIE